MKLKDIIDEDFVNYKKPSMFLSTCYCDWKCLIEQNLDVGICQNHEIAKQKNIEVSDSKIIERYLKNPITKSIVFGGLEPLRQFDELIHFIQTLREDFNCNDDIVIYTGYYPKEIMNEISLLLNYKNIIMKFGRFIPNSESVYDEVLGVYLNSYNQWAERIY